MGSRKKERTKIRLDCCSSWGIPKESARILLRYWDIFFYIVFLYVPASAAQILSSQIRTRVDLFQISETGDAGSILATISNGIIRWGVYLPFFMFFSLCGKACVVNAIRRADGGCHVGFLDDVVDTWRRMASTYVWTRVVIFLCSMLAAGVALVLQMWGPPGFWLGWALFSVAFAQALVLSDVAMTVSAMEPTSTWRGGNWAICRGFKLLSRQRRVQIGLVATICWLVLKGLVTWLFLYRSLTWHGGPSVSLLEGAMVMWMHAAVCVLEDMTWMLFYWSWKDKDASCGRVNHPGGGHVLVTFDDDDDDEKMEDEDEDYLMIVTCRAHENDGERLVISVLNS